MTVVALLVALRSNAVLWIWCSISVDFIVGRTSAAAAAAAALETPEAPAAFAVAAGLRICDDDVGHGNATSLMVMLSSVVSTPTTVPSASVSLATALVSVASSTFTWRWDNCKSLAVTLRAVRTCSVAVACDEWAGYDGGIVDTAAATTTDDDGASERGAMNVVGADCWSAKIEGAR